MKLKILLYYIFFIGCNNPTAVEYNTSVDVQLEFNLPVDENGYYRLELDTTTTQTIHAFSGKVYPSIFYKRLEWNTTSYWEVGDYVFTPVNPRSYTDEKGKFGNVLGPVIHMKGDTMQVTVSWDPKKDMDSYYDYNPTETKTFYIILE